MPASEQDHEQHSDEDPGQERREVQPGYSEPTPAHLEYIAALRQLRNPVDRPSAMDAPDQATNEPMYEFARETLAFSSPFFGDYNDNRPQPKQQPKPKPKPAPKPAPKPKPPPKGKGRGGAKGAQPPKKPVGGAPGPRRMQMEPSANSPASPAFNPYVPTPNYYGYEPQPQTDYADPYPTYEQRPMPPAPGSFNAFQYQPSAPASFLPVPPAPSNTQPSNVRYSQAPSTQSSSHPANNTPRAPAEAWQNFYSIPAPQQPQQSNDRSGEPQPQVSEPPRTSLSRFSMLALAVGIGSVDDQQADALDDYDSMPLDEPIQPLSPDAFTTFETLDPFTDPAASDLPALDYYQQARQAWENTSPDDDDEPAPHAAAPNPYARYITPSVLTSTPTHHPAGPTPTTYQQPSQHSETTNPPTSSSTAQSSQTTLQQSQSSPASTADSGPAAADPLAAYGFRPTDEDVAWADTEVLETITGRRAARGRGRGRARPRRRRGGASGYDGADDEEEVLVDYSEQSKGKGDFCAYATRFMGGFSSLMEDSRGRVSV